MYLTKFHGMEVIADSDLRSAMGNEVIEVNSNNDLVCRYYDTEGNAEDNPMVINLCAICAGKKKVTEANITGYIKREVGKNSILISESAVSMIKEFVSAF